MFKIRSPYQPAGGQDPAIKSLIKGLTDGLDRQVLLGVTGSGKTYTMAQVIASVQRPTLVMAHNKTLAAQLYQEFKDLFPENAVEYFVSYYDYYQPEAYIPGTDTYIEKDSAINDEIDRMRHSATRSVLERRDVIVVASVSCIYGIGSPHYYRSMLVPIEAGHRRDRDGLLRSLVELQYERNEIDFHRGTFRVRGDTVEVFPAYEKDRVLRIEFFGDEVERLVELDPLTGEVKSTLQKALLFPNSHYVTPPEELQRAIESIRKELGLCLTEMEAKNQLLFAQRLEQRTTYDLEMLGLFGHCKGVENYSRHLDGRPPGTAPSTLLDYFPDDFLCVVDESHVMLPQIQAMSRGDESRKRALVDYGFRLPCALDNRPLTWGEWLERIGSTVFVSATPGDWELQVSQNVAELIIRPTGLVDPEVLVRPVTGQVEDVVKEIGLVTARGFRTLVATLTRRMAEDLTEYLGKLGIRARYLHADVDTLDRIELLAGLRQGLFDVLVGVNLLREGLDLPEVALVAVLDADKEGFLRGRRSLIQVSGRAARNLEGRVIFYADRITDSIDAAVREMERRRKIQTEWNEAHGIIPRSIEKPLLPFERALKKVGDRFAAGGRMKKDQLEKEAGRLEKMMYEAAEQLEFELAASLRDDVQSIRALLLTLDYDTPKDSI